MKRSFGKYSLWASGALLALLIGVQVYSCVETITARQSVMPKNFGNFEHVRDTLPASDKDTPFTFVIVGDTRSKGTFESLAKEIRAANPVFVAILGDWVEDGNADQHAYFRQESAEYNFNCPVFFTPGNHDVDPQHYSLDRFETDYGPSNVSFVYKDNIFIFIRHLDKRFSNADSLTYLRSLDPTKLASYRNRFVFMHIPPWVSADIPERHTVDEKEYMQIFEDLHIDYVMAADFHGYNRTRLRGVEYIITGGGGSHLHESQGRQFHHALAITIAPDMFSERILPMSAQFDLEDWMEMNAVVYVGPFILENKIIFVFIDGILLCLFLLKTMALHGKHTINGQ